MTWKQITEKEKFKKIAKSICEVDEARYSLLYGMILDDVFGSHLMLSHDDKAIALQTSASRPLVVSDMDITMARDMAKWLEAHHDVQEIVGTKETINLILDNMRSNMPGYPELIMDQRIYRLDKLKMPNLKLSMRQATLKDLPLVTSWFFEFMLDAFVMQNPEKSKIAVMAEKRIKNNEVYLLVKDGNPVSMACSNRPTINGVTVNGVFTPIEHRANGYATKVVALLSEKLLKEYKFCCLYTDLNNPTSNKIYTAIGYKEVCDSLHYRLRE